MTTSATRVKSTGHAVLGRRLLAVLIFVHGFAHLVGVTDTVSALRDDTSVGYAFDRWIVAAPLLLAGFALVWAVLAAGFAAAAVATWSAHGRWPRAVMVLAGVSTLLCFVALPDTAIGVAVNLVLIALILNTKAGQ